MKIGGWKKILVKISKTEPNRSAGIKLHREEFVCEFSDKVLSTIEEQFLYVEKQKILIAALD
ncbi:hypothetical protein WN55_05792 [Dufourea novaeangliae]|uniref:Uncharacterized protein n=1 Tax=Dufourea novaeangliae TaxID=178035 RepID=A0A154P1R1_DUFNO|nr:hypothetical protein WN55_05792 [Dufourea novaeangliae]